MRRPAGSLSSLRDFNRLKVLEVVREQGTISRAEIATRTGLARSTVSTLVAELQDTGLVISREDIRPDVAASGGRPPSLLSLDPGAGAVIGIQFDHHFVRVAIADLSLTVLTEGVIQGDVDNDAQAGLDAAAALVDELLAHAGIAPELLIGAGVALSAPVDRYTGQVGSTTILPSWVGIDIASTLHERLGVPVEVENDANLGALAESVLGAGRDIEEMVYVMLSSGIGGGLILGGQLYRGARGIAGEIGHVSVDDSGHMCRCGNRGCLETMVGGAALTDLLRRSHGQDMTIERMISMAADGDPGSRRVLVDAGATIGRVVAALCNEFNPQRVVVGGELALAGDLLLDPMRESIRRYAIPAATEYLEVVAGALRDRAELMGALALIVGQSEQVLSGRIRVARGG